MPWMLRTCLLIALAFSVRGAANPLPFKSELREIDGHPLHWVQWRADEATNSPAILLLSGPIDSWHSDSAWFANLGPALADTHHVIAMDRAGMMTQNPDAPLGYYHAAKDVKALVDQLAIKQLIILAFASSNLTVMPLVNDAEFASKVSGVVMIDPDVLTEFSIKRYKGDAQPFKQNLDKYLAYIGEGKYTPRSEQKSQADLEVLKNAAGDDPLMDWSLVDKVLNARLNPIQQANTFEEIARYAEDLDAAKGLAWPADIPLVVFDTAFEQHYIDATEEPAQLEGLKQWMADATVYYQALANSADDGRYIQTESKQHLYQVENPKAIVEAVDALINH